MGDTIQVVFVVLRPTARIRQVRATIMSGPKWTWAILPTGRRCLLGTSAFFTHKAAEVRKLGLLRKIAESAALANMPQLRHLYGSAQAQLSEYARTGVLH